VVSKELVRDLIPDLKTGNGYVVDKVESFAIDAAAPVTSSPTMTVSTTARARPTSGPSAKSSNPAPFPG
jgi:hypothetical protein